MADKILGMQPRTALFVIGGSAAAAAVYLWWRRRKQAAAPAPTVATGCTDASGNAAPCPDSTGVDVQGQLSVIQTELESVLAGQAADTGKGGDSGSDSGSDSDSGGATGKPGSPGGLKVTSITASGFKASWTAPTTGGKPSNYTYDVETSRKLVKSGPVMTTTVTVSGLKKSTAYTFFVRACNHSGCSAQVSAPVKTKA